MKNAGIIDRKPCRSKSQKTTYCFNPAIGSEAGQEVERKYWCSDFYQVLVITTAGGQSSMGLETMDLDGLSIKLKTLLLVGEEFLNIFALITLELDHLSHLTVDDDGAIASELLLDDLEDLLLVELLRETLDRRQSLTTISLLNSNMDVILRLLGLSCVFVGFGEGVEGLKIFD
jgi:hypothetical protein